jgi:hypothetical protein
MYHNLGNQKSVFLLFGLSVGVCIPVYIIYRKGPQIRARSKYAREVEEERVAEMATRQELFERREALETIRKTPAKA